MHKIIIKVIQILVKVTPQVAERMALLVKNRINRHYAVPYAGISWSSSIIFISSIRLMTDETAQTMHG